MEFSCMISNAFACTFYVLEYEQTVAYLQQEPKRFARATDRPDAWDVVGKPVENEQNLVSGRRDTGRRVQMQASIPAFELPLRFVFK